MECNSESVVRVKRISKMKLKYYDFVGAKKYMLITQCLFSKLENINQILAVINVHTMVGERVGNNEMDFYGIFKYIYMF